MANAGAVMKAIMVAAVIASLAVPAYASTWYVLDASKAECRNTATISPLLASPYVFENGLRSEGNFRDTVVTRDDNHHVVMVIVKTQKGMNVAFFPTNKDCMDGLQIALKQGIINNPNELK